MEGLEKKLGRDHKDTVEAVMLVSLNLKALGPFAEAEKYFRRLAETTERQFGSDAPQTLLQVLSLAGGLLDLGKRDEAEPLFQRILSAKTEKSAMGYSQQAAANLAMAKIKNDRDDFREALVYCRAAATIAEREFGMDHQYTLQAKTQMAVILANLGKNLEAAALARQVLAHYQAHPDLKSTDYQTAKSVLEKTMRDLEARGTDDEKK